MDPHCLQTVNYQHATPSTVSALSVPVAATLLHSLPQVTLTVDSAALLCSRRCAQGLSLGASTPQALLASSSRLCGQLPTAISELASLL